MYILNTRKPPVVEAGGGQRLTKRDCFGGVGLMADAQRLVVGGSRSQGRKLKEVETPQNRAIARVVDSGGSWRRSKPLEIECDGSIWGVVDGDESWRSSKTSGRTQFQGLSMWWKLEELETPQNRARQLNFGSCRRWWKLKEVKTPQKIK